MNKYISCILTIVLGIGVALGAVHKLPAKVSKHQKLPRIVEPTTVQTDIEDGKSQVTTHRSASRDNTSWSALVDSSTNGYGMYSGTTRPLYVDEDNGWFFVHRQWAGENTTHGQLGAAYSPDGMDWTNYNYINVGFDWPPSNRQARYPSALGNSDYPYAFWNEYTGIESTYGGRPYYTYDEFGWDGGSFAAPIDIDLQWGGQTDQWVGSPGISSDGDNTIVNVAYNDWTRNNYYMFHSEAYEDGYLVFGSEFIIIDEPAHLVPGDAGGSYNSSPTVSMTPDGMGAIGLVGLFAGADEDASQISNNHTFIFKMTDDHGVSWYGPSSTAPPYYNDNYYFVPDNVFEHMISNEFTDYFDPCEENPDSASAELYDFWSYYEFDMKVDSDGNPHIVLEILPCGDSFCYYYNGDGSELGSGFYHFTIDRNHLENPGFVNTPTGWNYSKVVTGSATWAFSNPGGDSFIWQTQCQLAFDKDDPNLVWMVTDLAVKGPVENADPADPYDCEEPWEYFPEWSEDILVFKSTDNGATWWNPLNATNTPDLTGGDCDTPSGWCSPEEQFPHTFQWGTSDEVYYVFQMPDWYFNEIGDMLGADHKNRLYGGSAEFTNNNEPEYPGDVGGTVEVTIANQANWNLVGLPVETEDNNYTQVFPNSINNTLYAFDAGYVSAENLDLGEGYWLRFDAEGENMVEGGSVNEISVTLASGWNLITGGSEIMGVETISDPDGIIVANTLYGFSTGYESSTVLDPGKGYWIRTSAEGDVVIGGATARSREFVNRLENASSISFNGKALYFDANVPEAEAISYSLPPVPPAGAFDVRYDNDLIYAGSIGNIAVMNPYGNLDVSYHISDNSKWILTSTSGDIFELSGSGHFSMTNIENAEFTLIKSEINVKPVMFGLQGSYPNPFNPTTTIHYSVETEGITSLVVYDMMGREIKSLVSGYLTPNHYSVVWNGRDNSDRPVPSGIYLYRLNSGEFTDMKKVMLLK